MDIISRLPGCAGQAADAVSDYTQVKMEDAPVLLKIPKTECPDIWIRLPRHTWPKLVQYGRPSCLLERNLYGIFRQTIMGKAIWDVSLYISKKDYFYLCTWWKLLNKEVDLGEPTSFFDHVYLGCTQRQCEISKDIGDNYRTMFESRVSAERKEKLPYSENRASSWSYGREGHAKKCVERYCEVSNKTTQQLHKVSTPCIDDHISKKKNLNLLEKCQNYALKLARIGRPDILWSVNKFARSITKWTKACDKRLNRLISYIHHTCEYKQYCHVGNAAKQCSRGLFQDSDFTGDLEDSKSTSGGTLCIFGRHQVGCARKQLPFRTVQKNLRSSHWKLDWD